MLYMGKIAAGSITSIGASFIYFIQRTFQQREDEYRNQATAKHVHLEFGNHWLLIIQSIDTIENSIERQRRQERLVDVLTAKLGANKSVQSRQRRRTSAGNRSKNSTSYENE